VVRGQINLFPPPIPKEEPSQLQGTVWSVRGRGALPPTHIPLPCLHTTQKQQNSWTQTQHKQYRIQNTEYLIHNTEILVHKITTVPVFYMALILMRQKPLLGPLEGVDPKNIKWHSLHSLPFQGPPLPMALKLYFPHRNYYVPRHINRYINS
jgi:hypothetical protein